MVKMNLSLNNLIFAGDFWSYNSTSNKFVVSPEPDVSVHPVDIETFRCLILGTDGLWNMLSPSIAVAIVQATENHNEKQVVYPPDQFVMQYVSILIGIITFHRHIRWF